MMCESADFGVHDFQGVILQFISVVTQGTLLFEQVLQFYFFTWLKTCAASDCLHSGFVFATVLWSAFEIPAASVSVGSTEHHILNVQPCLLPCGELA